MIEDECAPPLAYIGFAVTAFVSVMMLSRSHLDEGLIQPKLSSHQEANPFPWEPRARHDNVNEEDTQEPMQSSHNQGVSDFMTMMTFANHSLRQPSCPCCR
jgi:hypothetical protein